MLYIHVVSFYHFSLLIIIIEDPNPNAVTSKREADGFISDTENMAIAPRKRRRRIVTSSEEEDDDEEDDEDHNPAVTTTSPFSDMQELTPTPDWDDDDDDSDEKNGGFDTFEELSEGEERRRRVGSSSADPDDFRYLDPELYGLRRSARRSAAVSNAQRKHKSYVCTLFIH